MNTRRPLDRVSVIIPLGPREDLLGGLLKDFRKLPPGTEVVMVYPAEPPGEGQATPYSGAAGDMPKEALPGIFSTSTEGFNQFRQLGNRRIVLISSRAGRAVELNTGANFAAGDFFWFLHADSRFNENALKALDSALAANPEALHFFRLKFMNDGCTTMVKVNEWGGRIRSERFKVPFGDQGFCISRENYFLIGGFPEKVSYGEDHLFLWKARQLGINPVCTGMELYTSARKYRQSGWGRLTLKYQYLWLKQAIPEFGKLLLGNLQK